MSTVGNESYTWTLLKCAHVFSASTFLLTDLPNLFFGNQTALTRIEEKFPVPQVKKKKKKTYIASVEFMGATEAT